MNVHALPLPLSFSAAVLLAFAVTAPALATQESCAAAGEPRCASSPAARDTTAAAHPSQVLGAMGVRGEYALDNGESLTIEPRLTHLRVRYGTRESVAVRADGRGNFVSDDGRLSLRIALRASGEAGDVQLTMPSAWQ